MHEELRYTPSFSLQPASSSPPQLHSVLSFSVAPHDVDFIRRCPQTYRTCVQANFRLTEHVDVVANQYKISSVLNSGACLLLSVLPLFTFCVRGPGGYVISGEEDEKRLHDEISSLGRVQLSSTHPFSQRDVHNKTHIHHLLHRTYQFTLWERP
jgi:hypothetical protein